MLTEDKVTELFCMADDFCKFFDEMMRKYTLKSDKKRHYHRDSTMSKAEIMLIMILFHDSGYRCLKHFYLETFMTASLAKENEKCWFACFIFANCLSLQLLTSILLIMNKKQTVEFKQMASRCCGLDVHKLEIVATVEGDGIPRETRSFSSKTKSLTALKDWLLELGVTHIAMESTGVYWKPVLNIL